MQRLKKNFTMFSIELESKEYHVEGHYTPPVQGRVNAPPELCYPPEPAEFIPTSIQDENMNEVLESMDDDLYEKLEDAICEKMEETVW